jgi:LuxR family transcriptional regulator, maltose regulon positive regulatory protein
MNRSRPPLRIARPCTAGNTPQIGPGDLPLVTDETPSLMRTAERALGGEDAAAYQPAADWPVGLYLAAGLRRRAADWCLRNDLPEEALEYSIAAGDVEMAARLVEQLWVPVCRQGRYAALQQWIQWLDDRGGVEAHSMVALAASVVSALTGRPAKAERWAEWIDRRTDQGTSRPCDPPSRAFPAVLRAFLCRRGVGQMLADADEAARRFAAQGIVIPVIALLQGIALVLSGDLDGGDAYLEAATGAGEQAGGTDVLAIALAERSLVAMAGRNWNQADGLAGQALAVLRRGRIWDSYATPLVCAVQARAFLHQGDIPAARQELVSAQRKRPVLTYALPYLAVQARIELARVHLALADLAGARTLMREIDDLLKRRPSLGTLVGEAGKLQAQLANERGSTVPGASALTAAELRLLPLLCTHLPLHEIAAELFLSPHIARTQAKSIYRKLGASSRSQAITLAGELELVEGLGTGSLAPYSGDEACPGRQCNSARRRAETLWARR